MTVSQITLILIVLLLLELAVVAAYERLLTVVRRENAALLDELDEASALMGELMESAATGKPAHPSLAVIDGGRS